VYCSGRRALIVATLALFGCAKKPAAPAVERIAILRFENLSGDPSLAWMGRAFSEVIAFQLAGTSGMRPINSTRLHSFDALLGARPISAPGISTEYTQALVAGATRIAYGDYSVRNGRLEAHLTVEDPRAPKTVATFTASAAQGDVLSAATALARDISPQANAYNTTRRDALASYIQGLESGDAPRMEQNLTAAVQADPDFPSSYRLLAQERLVRGYRAVVL